VKIEKEYYAQAIDPKTKIVRYQSADRDKTKLENWFADHARSGKFSGLEPHIRHRYLINGKVFRLQQKHYLWLAIAVQFLFIVWKLSQ